MTAACMRACHALSLASAAWSPSLALHPSFAAQFAPKGAAPWCGAKCKWKAKLSNRLMLLALQLKGSKDASPTTEIRINGEDSSSTAHQASPSGGAASYGASTMGITIQPSQQPASSAAFSDDDSMGDASPSRSPSPGRLAAGGTAATHAADQPAPVNTFAAAASGVTGLPLQQSVVTPHRVSMLRGGPVAGSYIDGR